ADVSFSPVTRNSSQPALFPVQQAPVSEELAEIRFRAEEILATAKAAISRAVFRGISRGIDVAARRRDQHLVRENGDCAEEHQSRYDRLHTAPARQATSLQVYVFEVDGVAGEGVYGRDRIAHKPDVMHGPAAEQRERVAGTKIGE